MSLSQFKTIKLESNIACGKTALLNQFEINHAKTIKEYNIKIVHEPVKLFRTYPGTDFDPLGEFYARAPGSAFFFQNWVLDVYQDVYTDLVEQNLSPDTVLLLDRNILSTNIFTELNQSLFSPLEYQYLCDKSERIRKQFFGSKTFGCDALFYLNSVIVWCFANILNRGRNQEADHIKQLYLYRLKDLQHIHCDKCSKENLPVATTRAESPLAINADILNNFIKKIVVGDDDISDIAAGYTYDWNWPS